MQTIPNAYESSKENAINKTLHTLFPFDRFPFLQQKGGLYYHYGEH